MDIKKIHKSFVSNRFPLILSIIVFIVLRLLGNENRTSATLWGITIIQIIIAISLLYLNTTFVIIRQRTLLPAFFYLLFTGTEPLLFYDIKGSISALIIVFCLFFLFATYQKTESQAYIFNISILLTLGSFLWTPLLFFFPLFWYGMYRFRSLNIRTLFAGIIGFFMIYLFIFTWSILKNDLSIFLDSFPDFNNSWNIYLFKFNLKEWIIAGFITILFIFSGAKIFMSGVAEKVRAMATLSYLYFFAFLIFIFFLFQNNGEKGWILILYIPVSFLISHFFTLSYKNWTIWLFFFTIIFFLGIFGLEYRQIFPDNI
ncbi:MAG: DUF6427 family protein [Dysgonamonadaceae bacterium]|jgi:hypothetical protein|nr:DUF6427 family protein [Dysgonamonadaceae bacterium]